MRRHLLKTGSAIAASLLLLTACSSGGFNSVELSNDPDKGTTPEIQFQTPVEVTEAQHKVLREGDGPEIKEGSVILTHAVVYRGSDGEEIGENYSEAGQTLKINDKLKEEVPGLYDALLNKKVGSIIAYSSPSTAGKSGQEGDNSTAVEVYEITQEIPSKIEGDMKDSPEGLPKVKQKDDGSLEFEKIEGKAPEKLISEYLIEGDGPEITEDQTVIADVVGARWEDGKTFESSWDAGSPASFPLDKVITGWKEGLKGKKVGSRVILSIPAEQAFGTKEQLGDNAQYPTGDLLYTVDILGAVDTPEPEPLPEPKASVVNEGDGEEVSDNDTLLVTSAAVTNGEPTAATPTIVTLDETMKKEDSFTYDQLKNARVGTAVDITKSVDAGGGQSSETTTRYTVRDIIPSSVEGTMQSAPDGLPQIAQAADGTPQISTPQTEPPKKLVSEYLIEGDGPEITKGQTVAVNYVGARWEDGKVFDSSYERGAPVAFPLDGVIEGWSEGLVGKKTGSRVVISIPTDKAYGTKDEIKDSQNPTAPSDELIFVVDILGATDTPDNEKE